MAKPSKSLYAKWRGGIIRPLLLCHKGEKHVAKGAPARHVNGATLRIANEWATPKRLYAIFKFFLADDGHALQSKRMARHAAGSRVSSAASRQSASSSRYYRKQQTA